MGGETAAAADSEHRMMMIGFADSMKIDPRRDRFPCCIVWTPLPFISWFVPFIGHVGICREDGVILDFAGPNFVCVDNFAFGSVSRYILIKTEKDPSCSSGSCMFNGESRYGQEEESHDEKEPTWDGALRKATQEYQHHAYNIFTCNCHSFVANNLNRLGVRSGGWNVVNLAALVFFKGRWVSKAAIAKSLLPPVIVYTLGIFLGGWTFIASCSIVSVLLIGWFIMGTYCFKKLIQL
ncbi:PREDICTED: protein RTE1-HOMOLOG-like [Camelina sativa]|uniref:Protein RTE1-HOMOLOG-like n=1 Tax=Camelina sativa TaxID=90675 RepID=A0ABM0YNX1_CAMSA|nr:PREDICTED: protein RTE1-HOMOLOG-like [Camelina sativa]